MRRVLLALSAELREFQTIFDNFLIFPGKIIHVLADTAFEFDEVVLGHNYVRNYEIYENTKEKTRATIVYKKKPILSS